MPTPPMKRGVEGGVSDLRDAMLGADVALEGFDRAQELPEASSGPRPLVFKDGTGPKKGQPVSKLMVPGGVQGYFSQSR